MPSLAFAPHGMSPEMGLRSPAEGLRAILARPDDKLDYARAKLAIDRLVDPALDTARAAAELDRLTAAASRLAGPAADANARLGALRRLIYEAGPWNEDRPFAYDHDDPHGQGRRGPLLPVYLDRRLGNCVSMPILFAILAERLGLEVALATAPDHVFVRWRGETGRILNLETTSGAHPAREAWFRENMPMSDRALANGLYMRSLGRREGVALMANSLLSHLIDVQSYTEAIEVADVILAHAPRDVWAILKKGTVYGHLIRTEFKDPYPHPFLIPMPQRLRYLTFARRNRELFEAAEALGWEPDDEASKAITERIESCS